MRRHCTRSVRPRSVWSTGRPVEYYLLLAARDKLCCYRRVGHIAGAALGTPDGFVRVRNTHSILNLYGFTSNGVRWLTFWINFSGGGVSDGRGHRAGVESQTKSRRSRLAPHSWWVATWDSQTWEVAPQRPSCRLQARSKGQPVGSTAFEVV